MKLLTALAAECIRQIIGVSGGGTGLQVRSTAILARLVVCAGLPILSGCESTSSDRCPFTPIAHCGSLYVLSGTLKTNWNDGQLEIVRFERSYFSSAGAFTAVFDLTFYAVTKPTPLPQNALFVIVKRRTNQFELFGQDASYSIIEDTLQNREFWSHRCATGGFFTKRGAWLEENTAIELAKAALNHLETSENGYTCRRYELGWIVTGHSVGTYRRTGDPHVVIGDDGQIKYISRGL